MNQETKWLYDLVDQMTEPLKGVERQLGSTDSATQKLHENINTTVENGGKIHGVSAAFGELKESIIGAAAGFGLWTSFEAVLEGVKDQMAEIYNVAKTLEKSQLVLSNLLGDPKQAAEAEEMMHDVAMHHAQDLALLREAYTHMVQKGVTPTKESLISLADFASSAGEQVGTLMSVVEQASMSGRYLPLAQYGVIIKQNAKDTDHLAATFHHHTTIIGKSDEALQNYILSLANMQGVHGLSAKTMDIVSGKETKLANDSEDLHKAMGDLFGGAIPGWMDFKSNVIEGLTDFFIWLKQNKEDIKDFFETIAVGLGAASLAWMAFNANMIIGEIVAASAVGAIGLLDGAVALLNLVLDANPIGIIITLIASLAAMIFYAWNHVESFRVFLFALWEAGKAVFKGIFDVVVLYFEGMIEITKGFGEILLGVIMLPIDHGKMFHQGLDDMVSGTKKLLAIPDAVKKAGKDVGIAWAQGQQEGHESFAKSHQGTNTANPEDAGSDKSVVNTKNALAGGADATGAGGAGGAGGGTSRNINVHIGVLGQVTVHAGTVKESLKDIRKMVHEELIGAVRDFEVAINQD